MDGGAIDFEPDPGFVPSSPDELKACLASWRWRMFSGQLYRIKTKGEGEGDDGPGIVVPFAPNGPQRRLLARLHSRNLVLKARQMGFTTLIDLLALDHALFNANQSVAIIAHVGKAAEDIFRNKVKFAYDSLPAPVRAMIPLTKETQTQLVFANGSDLSVTSSARSGTIHFLHVSEMGKVAAQYPAKAREITTGSLQAVPPVGGLTFIESTAEGLGGEFHDISKRAEASHQARKRLTPQDYRFHFFPWWQDDGYRQSPADVVITAKDHEYFDRVEGEMGCSIDLEQRAWYVAKRDSDFVSEPALMWREYPSTPDECWQASTEGKYLANVLAVARREGRIGDFPVLRHVPVSSYWDLGAGDDTVVWLHQRVGAWDNWIGYREAAGEGYLPFIRWMEDHGYLWDRHYLPHDAQHHRQTETNVTTPYAILTEMRPSWRWEVVPRVNSIQHGIDLLRMHFPTYRFHEPACADGIAHLSAYSRDYSTRLDTWTDTPRHDEHSHAADAIRQHAQAFPYDPAPPPRARPPRTRRATSMTA